MTTNPFRWEQSLGRFTWPSENLRINCKQQLSRLHSNRCVCHYNNFNSLTLMNIFNWSHSMLLLWIRPSAPCDGIYTCITLEFEVMKCWNSDPTCFYLSASANARGQCDHPWELFASWTPVRRARQHGTTRWEEEGLRNRAPRVGLPLTHVGFRCAIATSFAWLWLRNRIFSKIMHYFTTTSFLFRNWRVTPFSARRNFDSWRKRRRT